MAIRYSGDVELRIGYDARKKVYRTTVRAPGMRARGTEPPKLSTRAAPTSPESYDIIALAILREAKSAGFPVLVEGGSIVLRRTFQAPCPYRT